MYLHDMFTYRANFLNLRLRNFEFKKFPNRENTLTL